LEKLPENRYSSAQELANDLDRYLIGDSVAATGLWQKLRRWTRREPELVSRVGGLSIVALLTEFNYQFAVQKAVTRVHYSLQFTLLLWAISALLFGLFLRKGWRSDVVRLLWASADLVFLTVALMLLDREESKLLIGYPLLIAASGLWFRVSLVWYTTGLAVACFLLLHFTVAYSWTESGLTRTTADSQYPNIYVACLLLTGFVVARQLKRTIALTQYYENRQRGGDDA
jgi:serine/threonine-protein kinase